MTFRRPATAGGTECSAESPRAIIHPADHSAGEYLAYQAGDWRYFVPTCGRKLVLSSSASAIRRGGAPAPIEVAR